MLTINTTSPTFYWYITGSALGVTDYRVTYSDTEEFTANVETVTTTNTNADVNSPLSEGSTYWWYVELSYDNGSTWESPSTTWKFSVDAGASAVMPLVGSPANGVTISDNSPVLSWYLPTQSESTLSYEVEVADNPEFANVEVYDNISQLNAQVSELEEGEYYWRVRSKADGSTSSYSNTGNFKVGDGVTSVEDEEMPLTYDIDQNYPNPFNPTTTINYAIPEANYVSIKIYNMLGQEVKTLVNKDVKAGRHTIEWRGENNYGQKVSSGTYIYRITARRIYPSEKDDTLEVNFSKDNLSAVGWPHN
ncbi:MAG: FlgD immunoglobulin-like domain containing protein [Melioribacteraceae bacterium]|nr:FlgD immunoglobulin-like domain containing protein [Melioribacteraceae bacterium]